VVILYKLEVTNSDVYRRRRRHTGSSLLEADVLFDTSAEARCCRQNCFHAWFWKFTFWLFETLVLRC